MPEHEFQEISTKYLKTIEEKIIIPHIILSEVLIILTYKVGNKLADDVLDFLENDDRFVFINTDIEESLSLRKALNKKIAYADSVLIYMSLKYSAELISYDKQLIKIYNKIRK